MRGDYWRCTVCGRKMGDGPFRVPYSDDETMCRDCLAERPSYMVEHRVRPEYGDDGSNP